MSGLDSLIAKHECYPQITIMNQVMQLLLGGKIK
jgi:hypothetical protein